MLTAEEIVAKLKSKANPKNVEGMARFGINPENTLGVSVPFMRALAKKAGKDNTLSEKLWETGIHEARIAATMTANPLTFPESLLDAWVKELDSWDTCDQFCSNLAAKTPFAYDKAFFWCKREEEFVKRAGFVIMARFAVTAKTSDNEFFSPFFEEIIKGASDERNYVKKAVNWALRQIGKKNLSLNKKAITTAKRIKEMGTPAARWIAGDSLRELESEAVQERLEAKGNG